MKLSQRVLLVGCFSLTILAFHSNGKLGAEPATPIDTRTPMAKAFDTCVEKLLSDEDKTKFNECRHRPRKRFDKLNNREKCMSLISRDKVKPLMECVTGNSAI